ncbi:Putative CAMK/CAMKL/PASK protein kinase [Rhizopus microsporus]|nr:Putative CAMK/CAMKL/PASK protein kinase [Rhizopus microsporus]
MNTAYNQPYYYNKAQLKPSSACLMNYPLHPDFLANYIIGEELGAGGYGFVVSARERKTGIERAVKFIYRHMVPPHSWVKDNTLGHIPMEIYILKNIRHPNIIGYVDSYQDHCFCYLVMELHGTQWTGSPDNNNFPRSPALSETSQSTCSSFLDSPIEEYLPEPPMIKRRTSCDLFECIEKHNYFQEPLAKMIFQQIASCVAYLDILGICHRDIKDENIVIDDQYQVKLIDFGAAVVLPRHYGDHTKYLMTQFHGTVSFASPEILMGRPYKAESAEIWSLGVLLYTILFGEIPFHDTKMAIAGRFAQPKVQVSPTCLNLISWMLQRSPEHRPTIHQVLMHPWFSEF